MSLGRSWPQGGAFHIVDPVNTTLAANVFVGSPAPFPQYLVVGVVEWSASAVVATQDSADGLIGGSTQPSYGLQLGFYTGGVWTAVTPSTPFPVTTSGGSGDVQYAEGATTSPATGTVALYRKTSSGALSAAQLDDSLNVKVAVENAVSVTQGTSPWVVSGTVAATQSGSWTVAATITNPVTVTGTVAASQSGSWTVTANQGTSPWVVSGTVTANQGTSPWVVSGTVAATQSGAWSVGVTGTVNVTQSTSPWVVSLASTTITGTVAVTQSTSPWVVSGTVGITGTVGVTQSTSPWVVSGAVTVTGGPVSVTGTFWPYTLGQQTDANSVPVVLPADQITTLTPPTAAAIAAAIVANPPTVPVTQSTIPWQISKDTNPNSATDPIYVDVVNSSGTAGAQYGGTSYPTNLDGPTFLASQLVVDQRGDTALEALLTEVQGHTAAFVDGEYSFRMMDGNRRALGSVYATGYSGNALLTYAVGENLTNLNSVALGSPSAYGTAPTTGTSGATVAFVQAAYLALGNIPQPVSLAYTNNNAVGNLLLCYVSFQSFSSGTANIVTDSQGNTWQFAALDTSGTGALYYALNAKAGANTVTLGGTSNIFVSITLYEFSGVATSGALDIVKGSDVSSTFSIATTQSADLVFAISDGFNATAPPTITPGSGWTALPAYQGFYPGLGFVTQRAAWQQQIVAGAINIANWVFTGSSGQLAGTLIASFKSAPAASTVLGVNAYITNTPSVTLTNPSTQYTAGASVPTPTGVVDFGFYGGSVYPINTDGSSPLASQFVNDKLGNSLLELLLAETQGQTLAELDGLFTTRMADAHGRGIDSGRQSDGSIALNIRQAPSGYPFSASVAGTATLVKACIPGTPLVLDDFYILNNTAAIAYVQIFDAPSVSAVTLGTTVANWVIPVAGNSTTGAGVANAYLRGTAHVQGFVIACTTTRTGSTGATCDVLLWVN